MKKYINVICSVVLLLTLVSCSYSDDKSHNGEVAVFYSDITNEYVRGVKTELEALFDSSGVKFSPYNANGSEDSMEKQIEDAVKRGASALIVDVSGDDISEHAAEAAVTKDLPIVFFGTNVENDTDGYSKAAFVDMKRNGDKTDFDGTAKTIVKVLDNIVKGDGRFSGIDSTYHDGYMTVYVPALE